MFIDPNDAKEIEKSITFLVEEYNKSGYNPKPVVFHSLNLAFYLLRLGYDKEITIAAILHDLIEDSAVNIESIENKFGRWIADLVGAVSHDSNIKDRKEKYVEMFSRTVLHSKEAVILKCADTYQNSFYIKLVKDEDLRKSLIEKMKYFLDLSEPIIGKETVWYDLDKQYHKEKERLGK
ncbi:MAG: HD domain-containing protein [Patescibacteria group bacterium]